MKPVRLLIAVIALAALGGALWWSNRSEKAKEGKPSADEPAKILAIPADMVKQIDLKRRDGENTSVRFTDQGKWEITSPKTLAADPAAVAAMTSAASNLVSTRVVDSNVTDLASYGLAPALLEVDIATKDGKTSKLLIGENTPAGGDVYAKLDSDPRLFTMGGFNKASFDKVSKDLRDRRLMSFIQDKISRIELTAKNKTFELGKVSENEWQIVKPSVMRADGLPVDDLITKLKGAQMDAGTSDDDQKKSEAAFNSGSPVGTARVTDNTGTQTLEIRKNKDDYYAKSSAVAGVYKVGKDLGDALGKSIEDYRTKKLFDFGFMDPNKIEVKDGAKDLTWQKGGAKWLAPGNKEMDATSVQALIDKLRDLSASKFVDSGFTTPVLTVTVVTNEGKKTETLEISQAGSDFIARRQGEQPLYGLDANTAKDLRQAVADVKEAQPEKKK